MQAVSYSSFWIIITFFLSTPVLDRQSSPVRLRTMKKYFHLGLKFWKCICNLFCLFSSWSHGYIYGGQFITGKAIATMTSSREAQSYTLVKHWIFREVHRVPFSKYCGHFETLPCNTKYLHFSVTRLLEAWRQKPLSIY